MPLYICNLLEAKHHHVAHTGSHSLPLYSILSLVEDTSSSPRVYTGMPCVICGAPTEVPKTRPDVASSVVRRLRRCQHGHTFRTVETPTPTDATKFGVRRSGDNRLASDPFSRERLRKGVSKILFGRKGPLGWAVLDDVVDEAITRIERKLTDVPTQLSEAEFRGHPGIVGAIPDAVISDAVEDVLRDRDGSQFRVAELLYAMAIHGRNDNRPGWPDATAVMAWVRQRHPEVAPTLQKGHTTDQLWPRLAAPRRMDWRPETVMKRDGRTPDFAIKQLRKGIHAALWGRQDAEAKALMIAHLVLSDIRGQRTVQSTQISAAVLAHLRRVDDVGYLRWATIVKNIAGIREFADEAHDLIHAPSPRLLVTKDWRRWGRA